MYLAKPQSALLVCFALVGACDQSAPAPPPIPAPADASLASLEAADAACRLPLRHFGRSYMELRGSMLGYPTNRLLIDRAGGLSWNGERVEPRRLEDYLDTQARIAPPPLLFVTPDRDAPCDVVQAALAAALQAGRCRPDRCVFEWPGTNAPPALPPPAEKAASGVVRQHSAQ